MAGQDQTASVKLEGLACVRGGRMLFKGLSFALTPGEAALITGPNGVGKSSLLRMIAGLLDPFAGSILVSGQRSLADEALALDPEKPLAAALGFWADQDGGSVAAALNAYGLDHLATVPVRILSTGQRKRAVLARTMASQSAIWLLDEPGNGLDSGSLARLDAAMAAHRAAGGIIIAASHQPVGLPDAARIELAAA